MNKFWKQAAEVTAFGLILLLVTSPITRSVWSQAPIKGEVSTGVYQNFKTDGSGRMQVAPTAITYSGTQSVNINSGPVVSAIPFSNVNVTSATTLLANANSSRRMLWIRNASTTANLNIGTVSPVTATNSMPRYPGDEILITFNTPTTVWYGISLGGTSISAVVGEGQ